MTVNATRLFYWCSDCGGCCLPSFKIECHERQLNACNNSQRLYACLSASLSALCSSLFIGQHVYIIPNICLQSMSLSPKIFVNIVTFLDYFTLSAFCLCAYVCLSSVYLSIFPVSLRLLESCFVFLFLLYRSTTPSVFLHSFVVSLSCCRFLWQYLPLSLSLLVSMWSSLSLASTRGNLNLPVAIVTHLCQTTRAIKNEWSVIGTA